jgi:UDP-4-amino-4,6-dideoxy-N-acetyl-beta-L-altrosamine N-acetyltransferase
MLSGCLRPMKYSDKEMVLKWRNHPDIRQHMYSKNEISEIEHHTWFEKNYNDPNVALMVFVFDGEPSGFVNISNSRARNVADWGFYLAPDSKKGIGKLLGRAALKMAFEKMKLHKLCAEVLASNQRSVRFHETLGFVEEGKRREQHFDGMDYCDVLYYGLLSREWLTKN